MKLYINKPLKIDYVFGKTHIESSGHNFVEIIDLSFLIQAGIDNQIVILYKP
jgi:hypothetical protein